METLKRRFIAHFLIGLLVYIAVACLAMVSWLSSNNNYSRRGCFGYLGVGWEPDEWGNRGCNYSSAYVGQPIQPRPDWPEWRSSPPNLAEVPIYNIPTDYPEALQQAIRGLPFYSNAKAQDFDPITIRQRSSWVANLPALTVQTSPVYTITAFRTTDGPHQVRSFYKNALEKTGWQFLRAGPSYKDAKQLFTGNSCKDSSGNAANNKADAVCTDIFLSRYAASEKQERQIPYYMYLTTTLTSTMGTAVELQIEQINGF